MLRANLRNEMGLPVDCSPPPADINHEHLASQVSGSVKTKHIAGQQADSLAKLQDLTEIKKL